MVEVAAIMAQAASTALPPFWKIIAPAVAASGLPVTAIQCAPCSAGFWVRAGAAGEASSSVRTQLARTVAERGFGVPGFGRMPLCLWRSGE